MSCWAISEPDHVYADEYNFFLFSKLCQNEREHSILTSKFKKSILFSIIFDLFWCILEQVFQMAHKQIVPPRSPSFNTRIRNRVGGV